MGVVLNSLRVLACLVCLTLLCCAVYPLAIFAMGQLFFPDKANGSLIYINRTLVGSHLLGQHFSAPKYFWGRQNSASKQDPDITVESALQQIPRVAHARHLPVLLVEDLVGKHTHSPMIGFFGPNRVNVLTLNLDLDQTPLSGHIKSGAVIP